MKVNFTAIVFFSLFLSITAFGQQAKLEGYVSDEKERPVANIRIIAPGGQSNVADTKGHFTIQFPDSVKPGQATRIETDRHPDWVIFEPMLGNCVTQSAGRNFEPLKVIIVPKGSALVLSPKRLSQVIAVGANAGNV